MWKENQPPHEVFVKMRLAGLSTSRGINDCTYPCAPESLIHPLINGSIFNGGGSLAELTASL